MTQLSVSYLSKQVSFTDITIVRKKKQTKKPQKNNEKPRKSFTVHQVNRKSTFLYLSGDVGKIEWQRTKIKFLLAK